MFAIVSVALVVVRDNCEDHVVFSLSMALNVQDGTLARCSDSFTHGCEEITTMLLDLYVYHYSVLFLDFLLIRKQLVLS